MSDATERIILRSLTTADLGDAHRLSQAVGWPHRLEDWQFVLGAGHGLAALLDGELVGTAMWWTYDGKVARLGMVIVDPAIQKMGIGKTLMLAALDAIAVPTVMLNATAEGEPLYRRLGFDVVGSVIQHQGVPQSMPSGHSIIGTFIRAADASDLAAIVAMDAAAGGERRDAIIAHLLANGDAAVFIKDGLAKGFAIYRRFGRGHVIGPIVAMSADMAKDLIAHWIAAKPGQFLRVDVPVVSGLSDWLSSHGLRAIAPAITMVRGTPVPSGSTFQTFGLINQALG